MSVLRRRLLMGGGRWRYVDEFAALSGRWDAQAGSVEVSGGALQAATLGDWLGNLIVNGESWTGGPPPTGWTAFRTTLVQADSTLDPGAASGGDDNYVGKLTITTAIDSRISQTFSPILFATYRCSVLAYAPSGNTQVNAAQLRATAAFGASGTAQVTAEDVWQTIGFTRPSTSGMADRLWALVAWDGLNATDGDIAYFDSAELYRQNVPALLAGWRSPNHVATLSHVSPASGFVPFGYICRYTDSLNYWEVRVLPNTAGNDLQIIQVTAGVETTRAEADIDWTSNDTDELMVDCRGSTIATYHRKSGAGTWTAGPSYASATQGQTSPHLGVMLYEAGVGRLSGFEIRAL